MRHFLFVIALFFNTIVHADTAPQRIVALEFSFVDALSQIDIIPIGIADDNDPKRIAPLIKEGEKYQSVGTRAQPNLEIIAQLKPDLIIADTSRHGNSLGELEKIAPVLLLNSRNGSFQEILEQAQEIADRLDKSALMKEKIEALHTRIATVKGKLPANTSAIFAVSRETSLNLHSKESYTGALLDLLGLKTPDAVNHQEMYEIDFTQLLALNPDYAFIANYRNKSIFKDWQTQSLWSALTISQEGHALDVDPNIWARLRGIAPAHQIIDTVEQFILTP